MVETRIAADVKLLKQWALFEAVDEAGRKQLAERAHHRRLTAGERIFRFGDAGESMLAVVTGTVRISRPTTPEKEIVLADLGPGEIIGEIAVLDGKPRSADASALTNVELLVLDRREIMPFLEQHPRLCLSLLALLCARLRLADERMADVGFVDLPIRLAKTLLRLAPPSARNAQRFKLPQSQQELGIMIGCTRETVNRILGGWEKEGLVLRESRWTHVLDPAALAARADIDES